jgi:hypothetical protein
MRKKGTILVENIVFIILNILFLSILILFLLKQGSGTLVLEQVYSKEIAMFVDSSISGMEIKLDIEKGKNLAEKSGVDFGNAVIITGNFVTVKLGEGKGYTYSFFNDVDVSANAEKDNQGEYTGMYVFRVKEKGRGI